MSEPLGRALNRAAARLTACGIADAASDARVLAGHLFGLDRSQLLIDRARLLTDSETAQFDALIERRLRREPVSRITGTREFWSLPFRLSPATLDPRPDSETVVASVLEWLPDRSRALRVLDLGTGSGCLLLALLSELPAAWGVGIDRDPAATVTARRNAERLGLAGRTRFVVADWAAPVNATFDIVVSNPPYVARKDWGMLDPEVASFDPPLALDGGPDGLDAYRTILSELPRLLAAPGAAILEIGYNQAEPVIQLTMANGLACDRIDRDLSGVPRAIVICHKPSPVVTKKSWILSDLPLGSAIR